MEDQKQIQEKYMQMQLLEQQMQQIQKHLQLLENQLHELNITEQALDEIKTTKIGAEILVPMASGIFVKAELKDNKELAVNVGANTVVKKSIEEAKKLITSQVEDITNMQQNLTANFQKLTESAQMLEKELSKLIK